MIKQGFEKIKETLVSDIDATLVEYRHTRAGTRLLHIDRKDDNKTFLIGFKTPPTDDTGVFHIIEHSVLCGSKKFPLKEPFVELLKGSLNTFLNAMTYPDKTVYPVSSTNDKDFLNLIDVYMDAVLNPSFRQNENIFLQEGHRLVTDSDDNLTINGVVYNEMKGAYSSPEEIEAEEIMKMLYKGSPYQYSSGGDPDFIPELTYEGFVDTHAKYYNPTDAYIIIDGSVDTEAVFGLLDSYLSEYERAPSGIEIPDFALTKGIRESLFYSIDNEDSEENKTRLTIALPGFRYDEKTENGALAVIRGALMGGVSAPFCKKILDAGLCEDVYATPIDGIYRGATAITFINVKDGKEKELEHLALRELREAALNGINKDELRASVSSIEFSTREKNHGSTPLGIIYAISVLDSWLYSDDYISPITFEEMFSELKEKIDTDYYDKLLLSVLPDADDEVVLTLYPSKTVSLESEKKLANALFEKKEKMSDAELAAIKEKQKRFEVWQQTPDSKENIAKLPTLAISDISEEPDFIHSDEYTVSDTRVISIPEATHGITYLSVYFDISDLSKAECSELAILSAALTNLPTSSKDVGTLRTLIKGNLGFITTFPLASFDKDGNYTHYLKLSAGMLNSKKDSCIDIVKEILTETVFDEDELRKIINQLIIAGKEALIGDGVGVAIDRANAAISETALLNEYTGGYEFLLSLSKYDSAEAIGELSERLKSLLSRIITKERATVTVGGEYDSRFVEGLIAFLPSDGVKPQRYTHELLKIKSEGIAIPSRISFAVTGIPYDRNRYSGDMQVVRTILNYEYLWSEIRAKGGAYGAGESIRDGFIAFYSYRDPSPAASLEAYRGIPKFLRDFANTRDSSDIKRYIIGTFSNIDTVKSVRMKIDTEITKIFRGITYDIRKTRRKQTLSADKESLLRAADMIEAAFESAVSSTVGRRETLNAMGSLIDVIHDLK